MPKSQPVCFICIHKENKVMEILAETAKIKLFQRNIKKRPKSNPETFIIAVLACNILDKSMHFRLHAD